MTVLNTMMKPWWLGAVLMALVLATTAGGVTTDEEGEGGTGDLTTTTDTDLSGYEDNEDDEAIGFREDKVFLDFKEADIRDVLRVFARKARINIVPSQRVQGTVTVQLTDVHWEKALKLILEQNSFILQKDEDGIYKVFTQEEIGAVPLQTKVVRVSYIKADVAKKILESLLTKDRGTIEADKDGNKLVISDVPGKLDELEDVIVKLDIRVKQVSIEVQVLERTSGEDKDFGLKWDFLKGYKVSATDIKKSWTTTDTRSDSEAVYKSTVTHQDLEPIRNLRSMDQDASYIYGDPLMIVPSKLVTKTRLRTAILSADDLTVTLSALYSDSNTELISHPKIATVDNRVAKISVTRKVPIPQYAYNDQTGTYEIKSFTYEKIGITLEVTPQINQDGYITLEVIPSVSTQFGEKTFVISGGVIAIPIIDERSAETKVIVKSRETLVIGGLVSTDESITMQKVPFLGDIPLIKHLFRHKTSIMRKKDLLFFITPTLVEGADD